MSVDLALRPVAFKVKTTAPKQYCVRPNSGRIEPGERVEVQVLLQPFKEEPPTNAKCRDKFLVQSALISAEKETLPMTDFWAMQEREKDQVAEHKIRCVFLPPSSATVPEESEDGISSPREEPSTLDRAKSAAVAAGSATAAGAGAAYAAVVDQGSRLVHSQPQNNSSPSYSPSTTRSTGAEPPISIASLNNFSSSPQTATTRSYPSSGNYTTTSSSIPASTSYTSSMPSSGMVGASTPSYTNVSSSSRSPAELEAEIQRLRAQLAGTQGGSSVTRSGAVAQKSSGVPVHIVAAIAVGVFAVTYLFF
ncbi:phosphatidylinositol-binding protein scs2 [Malassezia yamatoensis]|uniref:Phosphatidylinositol-binding protein scs2 n=1 Tax=Malassezia yamatoensis TaxID=253288 RepID=A0AAJ5YV64_9BASI|nr:phosphatidylinositol-binding protein scs2 [Malassezia yamatoensis]